MKVVYLYVKANISGLVMRDGHVHDTPIVNKNSLRNAITNKAAAGSVEFLKSLIENSLAI